MSSSDVFHWLDYGERILTFFSSACHNWFFSLCAWQLIPVPVCMSHIYFWFLLIQLLSFEVSSHQRGKKLYIILDFIMNLFVLWVWQYLPWPWFGIGLLSWLYDCLKMLVTFQPFWLCFQYFALGLANMGLAFLPIWLRCCQGFMYRLSLLLYSVLYTNGLYSWTIPGASGLSTGSFTVS